MWTFDDEDSAQDPSIRAEFESASADRGGCDDPRKAQDRLYGRVKSDCNNRIQPPSASFPLLDSCRPLSPFYMNVKESRALLSLSIEALDLIRRGHKAHEQERSKRTVTSRWPIQVRQIHEQTSGRKKPGETWRQEFWISDAIRPETRHGTTGMLS